VTVTQIIPSFKRNEDTDEISDEGMNSNDENEDDKAMDKWKSEGNDGTVANQLHDQVDWYHVPQTQTKPQKPCLTSGTILDERIEEYILQVLVEEFHPNFNEYVIINQ